MDEQHPGTLSRIGTWLALAAYALFLAWHCGAVAGGSDNSGYMNEARLIAQGHLSMPVRAIEGLPPAGAPPYLYVPLGFKPAAGDPGRLVPTYPPGLPLLIVPAAWVVGWTHAGDLALIAHALAAVLLTHALARRCGLSRGWAMFAAAVLAASPLFLYTSLQALSDVPATAWAAGAVVAALMARERGTWSLASGLCLGVSFLIRPSDFLVALPVAIALGPRPKLLAGAALTALPGIVTWMLINRSAYGSPLESGYGAIGNEFHASLIAPTLARCGRWIPLLFGPVIIAAPALVLLWRGSGRTAALLLSWAVAFVAFYSAYRYTRESWWFLRFLLPAAPALVVAALLVVARCFERIRAAFPRPALAALATLLVLSSLGAEVTQGLYLDAWSIGRGERKYGRALAWLTANAPAGSVVLASQFSGAVVYYTDFPLLRAEEVDPATAQRVRASLSRSHRPLYAVVFPFEQAVVGRIPGRWGVVANVDDVQILRSDLSPRP
jgi:4-amino-4-deoxy-L-arabinose transferase-like glycosyltransferase